MRISIAAIILSFLITPLLGQERNWKKKIYGYNPKGKKIHFTFDDGPHPQLTPKLLDILKAYHIHATFFVLGEKAKKYPEIIKRMVAEGHRVASHSYNHPELTKLTKEKLSFQIEETEKILEKILGKRPYLMRPPYGALNSQVKEYLWDRGYSIVLWNIDTLDWKFKNVEKILRHTMLNLPKNGGIILLHDIHKTSVESVPPLIEALKEKGFEFIDLKPFLKAPPKPKMPKESEIKPLEGKGVITATKLNVRKGPGIGFAPITTLAKGIEVKYLGEYKGWKKIRYQTLEGPKIGWVPGKYVKTIGAIEVIRRGIGSENLGGANRD